MDGCSDSVRLTCFERRRPVRTEYTSEIIAHSARFEVDPNLVEALVLQESSGNRFAFRPELTYPYLWDVALHKPFRKLYVGEAGQKAAPGDFPSLTRGGRQQEWVGQQTSWGLGQIMGAVAREHEFVGLYLSELVEVELNLSLVVKILSSNLKRAHGDEPTALAAYNAGWGGRDSDLGREYAIKVLARKAAL